MTPSKNAAKNAQGSVTANGSAPVNTDTNAVNMLKADHRKVTALFRKFESAGSSEEKSGIVREICNELIMHTKLEEEIFYAACREANVEDSLLDEAQVEHDGAKLLIADLLAKSPDSPYYDAQVSVLSEYIKHHVGEEEKPSDGIFARARAAKLDMNALGQHLQQRKEELMQQVQSGTLEAPVPVSLDLQSVRQDRQENWTMARQNERERDDQGRFMSDDERYGGGRSRGGDDYRYWRASQEGWESREGNGRSEGSGRSRMSSRDDDDDRYSSRGPSGGRGSSHGGWFGDPRGHSKAARRGWQDR